MQTLYGIHVNNVGQVSVDVFSDRRSAPNKWRVYFCVSASSIARLRRVYAAHKKACYVTREWSPSRWRAYKEWSTSWIAPGQRTAGLPSLDTLETKSQGLKK